MMTDEKLRKWISPIALVLAGGLALSACNTSEGVGEDMQDAGEEIEDEAED